MHVYTVGDALEGPYDDTSGMEAVDLRDVSVTAWSGHGETSAGEAGHEAAYGAASPSHADDARWIDASASQ